MTSLNITTNSQLPFITISKEKRKDLIIIGIILLYCLVYAALRLSVSSSMDLDDAEQFIKGSVYSWGYSNQPPLYSWIIKTASLLFGMNVVTLIVIKYCLMFCFYFTFYLICRTFWDAKESLVITGSLLLFYTYAYDFNRHLSHTILVTALASITSLIYIQLVLRRSTFFYLLLGILIGLGIISKYNFVLFSTALILASITSKEGRHVIFDRRIFLSLLICCLIILPHFLWLIRHEFQSMHQALLKAHSGELKLHSLSDLFVVIGSSFYGLVAFPLIFRIFFRRRDSSNTTKNSQILHIFRWLLLYGVTLFLSVILIFRTGHFSEKWLAPVLFCMPLALFSSIKIDMNKSRFRSYSYLCIVTAVIVLFVRVFIWFFPDLIGEVQRIHTPFKAVSLQLIKRLQDRGIQNFKDLTVVTDTNFMAANITANIPGVKLALLKKDAKDIVSRGRDVIIVWDTSKEGIQIPEKFRDAFPSAIPIEKVESSYLHSKKFPPYILGVAVIPKIDKRF